MATHDAAEEIFEPLRVLGILGRECVAASVKVAEPWRDLLSELRRGTKGGTGEGFRVFLCFRFGLGWLGKLLWECGRRG